VSKQPPPEHVVFESIAKRIRCLNCGATGPIPLGTISAFLDAIRVFEGIHSKCQKPKEASK